MKAERRHELQENTLVHHIQMLPLYWVKYGTRILAVLVAVLLVGVLINYRIRSQRASLAQAWADLGVARQSVSALSSLDGRFPGDQFAEFRNQFADDAETAISRAEDLTDNPAVRAEALVARADLCYALAMLPSPPEATTRPTLNFSRETSALLDQATTAYQQVLDEHPEAALSRASAHTGLAAIAENRSQWDQAKSHYDSVTNDSGAPGALVDLAKARAALLDQLKLPVYQAPPVTQPAVAEELLGPIGPLLPELLPADPTTMPATTQPAPATAPAPTAAPAPTTAPTTQP